MTSTERSDPTPSLLSGLLAPLPTSARPADTRARTTPLAERGPIACRAARIPVPASALLWALSRARSKADQPGQRRLTRARLIAAGLLLLATLVLIGVSANRAQAAVTHEYEPEPSETLSKGVPESCAPAAAPCIPGALTGAFGIAPDGAGNMWVGDSTSKGSRVDRFNSSTGAFEGPQLVEEGGATALGSEGGTGVAVGHAFLGEQVYVQSGGGLAVYDGTTGKLAGIWKSGVNGVAVDGSSLGSGDVYVARRSLDAVQVFEPESANVGEEPAAPVAEIKGTCAAAGTCAGEEIPFQFLQAVTVSPLNGDVFVEDCVQPSLERCAVDAFEPTAKGVYSFLFQITEANKTPLGLLQGVAVDSEGDIYVAQGEAGFNVTRNVVDQYGPEGKYLGKLSGAPTEPFAAIHSVGIDPSADRVLVGDAGSAVPGKVFGPSIPIPDVEVLEPPEPLAATTATLRGNVNPDGHGEASCNFEYGLTTSYGEHADCEHNVPEGTSPAEVHSDPITGLQPDTTYHYRLDATNIIASKGHFNTGEGKEDEGTFITPGPGLESESSSEVSSSSAHLDATIDPNGVPTSYYFQYNTTGTEPCTATPADCTSLPATPEAIGATATPEGVNVEKLIQGLEARKTYHYRVVVLSEPTPGHTEVFAEADQTFTTQPPGSGFALPDGRQYELVSPPDKHGALLQPIGQGPVQSSGNGSAFTYLVISPTEDEAPGFSQEEQVFSTRGAIGWASQDISLPHEPPATLTAGEGSDYRFFSEDLSLGVAEPFGQFTSLTPEVFPRDTERTDYLRHDQTCQASRTTCYEPLVTAVTGYADVPEGLAAFGGEPGTARGGVTFDDATADVNHVVVDVGPNSASGSLYEWSAVAPPTERLAPASVLPVNEGGGETGGSHLGNSSGRNARHALSGDGSRVVWTTPSGGLYLRINVTRPQSATSAGGSCIEPADACTIRLPGSVFQIANSDDSRILFTGAPRLVGGAGEGDLYECEVLDEASGPRCLIRDVAADASLTPPDGAVLGASEDGSYVYFVSNAVVGDAGTHGATRGNCSGEEPSEQESASQICNLYVAHYDATRMVWEEPVFIAGLSGADFHDWTANTLGQGVYGTVTRVSSDGRWLTFMSQRSLTGYDNHDARSGKPDQEVYLYDSQTHKLICPSCNRTGARPDGVEAGHGQRLVAGKLIWPPDASLAANIPGGTAFELDTARYDSRVLSKDGRLFFNSSDDLVPQDVNGQQDVYEWEPAGIGGCSSSAPGFDAATGGCLALISSGTSAGESAFLDASETGNDVFFLTSEKLVPQDLDTSLDVYDAHVCSPESPCPASSVAPAKCTTADACWPAAPPQPEVFGAPAGATFSGPGSAPPPPPPVAKRKTAAQIRAEKLAKALRACHKDKNKKKRTACEKAAHKVYGPLIAKRAANRRRTSR